MVKPPATPPTPSSLLKEREAALSALRAKTASGPASDKQKAVLENIDANLATVRRERALRDEIYGLSEESAADPEPPDSAPEHTDWETREAARAEKRKVASERLVELRATKPDLYSDGEIASPCLPCLTAQAKASKTKGGDSSKADAVKPKPKNKLVEVVILNGFDPKRKDGKTDPVLGGRGLQWVNLLEYRKRFKRKVLPAWLQTINGKPVDTFDRLSRTIRIRVRFSLPGRENFWLKLVPGGKVQAYSAKERVSSSSYKLSHEDGAAKPTWLSGTTDSDGMAVVKMSVRTSGGDIWAVQAKDSYGTDLTSGCSIETTRGLFVCTVTMDTMAGIDLAPVRAEFETHKINLEIAELVPGPDGPLAHKRFIYADDARFNSQTDDIELRVKKVIKGGTFKGGKMKDMAPYVVTSNFYDMSPNYGDFTHAWIAVSPTAASNYGLDYHLWDPADPSVDWFLRAKAFTHDGTNWVELAHAPVKADFRIVGTPDTGYKELVFTPPAAYAALASLSLQVTTRIIDGGVNGFSSGDQGWGNYVAICRRHRYTNRVEAEMQQTVVHEIGHKVNFTAGPEPMGSPAREPVNGAVFRWLDASPTHYRARGHVGGHCFKDAVLNPSGADPGGTVAASLQPSFRTYDGRCVMFGSGGGGSGRKINFCGNCAAGLIKLDIEQGWKV